MSERKQKIRHSHRCISCDYCRSKIDIDEKIQLEDFDQINDGYIFYCNVCGESTSIIKL